MQIVIDIDENVFTRLFDNGDEYVADMRRACVAIRKGTPLPKGHGNIYDENDIEKGIENPYQCRTVLDGLELVKPIIEADPERNDEWDRVTMIDLDGNTHIVTFKKEIEE